MKKPLVIFLMGKAQSGKDTLADILIEEIEYGYKDQHLTTINLAFADALKDICGRNHGYHDKIQGRDILIKIGDDMRAIDKDAFVTPVLHFLKLYHAMGIQSFVISDMRYENEYKTMVDNYEMVPFVIRVQSVYEHQNVSVFAKTHPTENLEFTPDYNIVLPPLSKETMAEAEKEILDILHNILDRYFSEIE
jgi:hypothetical protein